MKKYFILIVLILAHYSISFAQKNDVKIIDKPKAKCVEINVDGKLFTSFLYSDTIPVLKKQVLFPINSANGVTITRGYPLQARGSERTDHPHHIGCWFNYGDVNGLDFWNNSDAIPKEKSSLMGSIVHSKVLKTKSGKGKGILSVSADWVNSKSEILLNEVTDFAFYATDGKRIIERTTKLTALNQPVMFKDNKEGLFGIRVTRELELPSNKPVELSDANGNITKIPVMDNTGVTGNYVNSEGVTGNDAWGKRARWVALSGNVKSKNVTVIILDNPNNVGFPSYWHARDYGLFAINPLGQNIFSEGKENLNYNLEKGKSVVFKYRIVILDSLVDKEKIEKEYKDFIGEK